MISRRTLLGSLAVAGAGMVLGPRRVLADAGAEATARITAFYDALLECMRSGAELGFDGRYRIIQPVLNDTFDVATMCRISVGPDWTAMSGEDKGAVLQTFDRYIITTYAARFRSYSNQKFEIGAVKSAGEDRVLVETKLVRSNGEPVELNYLFRLNENAWRVIDIYLAGSISQMAQLRAEFAQSLRQGGATALVAQLEQKIQDLKKEA